jgi:hypothetical protein
MNSACTGIVARRAGGVPKTRGGARTPEESVSPAGDGLIAFVRHCVAVVVEASTPEAQKERRLVFEPAWIAEIPVCQATLAVGRHTGDICINCQAAVSAPPSTSHEEKGVALADSGGGALDGITLNRLELGALLVGRLGRLGTHQKRPETRPPCRACRSHQGTKCARDCELHKTCLCFLGCFEGRSRDFVS